MLSDNEHGNRNSIERTVLILVLMEYALWQTEMKKYTIISTVS